jgi:PEP-CTERM motif
VSKLSLAAAALAFAAWSVSAPANAGVIHLNFAGLDGNAEEQVLNYYDGGYGGDGSGPGPNYGIVFGSDSLACSGQPGGVCNTAMIPGGPGANALFFLSGPGDVMNVAAGFNTGFSFYYSAPFDTGVVTVWSGQNGTGTLLATLNLALTTNGSGTAGCYGTNYCPYDPTGVSFSGTAESVVFSGTANYIAFADITLGASSPVPEPMTLSLLGAGLIGAGALRFRRKPGKAA